MVSSGDAVLRRAVLGARTLELRDRRLYLNGEHVRLSGMTRHEDSPWEGLAETRGPGADSFWSWREVMYRFALSMTPEHVEAVAAQLYAEMLEAGFTRVGEFHYLQNDPSGHPYANRNELAERVIAAALDVGLRICLLNTCYATGGIAQPLLPEQRRFQREAAGTAAGERAGTRS